VKRSDILTTKKPWSKAFEDAEFQDSFINDVLPNYVHSCRWFAAKGAKIKLFRIATLIQLPTSEGNVYLLVIDVIFAAGNSENYLIPIHFNRRNIKEVDESGVICKVKVQDQEGHLIEAVYSESFRNKLFKEIADRGTLKFEGGELFFHRGRILTRDKSIKQVTSKLLKAEQSNTTLVFNQKYFLKLFRRLYIDSNPDYELTQFLTETAGFAYSPTYAGSINWNRKNFSAITLGLMQEKVENKGEAWSYTLEQVRSFFNRLEEAAGKASGLDNLPINRPASPDSLSDTFRSLIGEEHLKKIALLGKRTAEMHIALSSDKNNREFAPLLFNEDYSVWLKNRLIQQFDLRYNLVESNLSKLSGLAEEYALKFLDSKQFVQEKILGFDPLKLSSSRIRLHGDYHLGQVLITGEDDFCILDFEGEPEASIRDRKVKQSPLKDVAGMLRSFHYAVYANIFDKSVKFKSKKEELFEAGEKYYCAVAAVYLDKYVEIAMNNALDIGYMNEINYLLRYHLLEKAVYELGYELNSRPSWVIIPLQGIMQILETETE